jgi:hypothetical protein
MFMIKLICVLYEYSGILLRIHPTVRIPVFQIKIRADVYENNPYEIYPTTCHTPNQKYAPDHEY